jgi:hypothetical protein
VSKGAEIAEVLDGPVGWVVVGAVVLGVLWWGIADFEAWVKNLFSNVGAGVSNAVGAVGQAQADSAVDLGNGESIYPGG